MAGVPRRGLLLSLAVLAPLALVYLLPPDTSLAEVRASGSLRVCLPPAYPPLVTGDRDAPGIEVELLQALAGALGLALAIESEPAMVRDFNPRNWRVTRARCAILGGGLVASELTRSFLDTTPPFAETGWALLGPKAAGDLRNQRVGVLASPSGLDRIALGRRLRETATQAVVVTDAAELVAGLSAGRFDIAITEKLLADSIAARQGWQVAKLDGAFASAPLAFGLWKGDLTLKRAVVAALQRLQQDGSIARILARYTGSPVS